MKHVDGRASFGGRVSFQSETPPSPRGESESSCLMIWCTSRLACRSAFLVHRPPGHQYMASASAWASRSVPSPSCRPSYRDDARRHLHQRRRQHGRGRGASALCVFRTGADSPLWQSRSCDGGHTWAAPEPIGWPSVKARLQVLPNGVLACASGRGSYGQPQLAIGGVPAKCAPPVTPSRVSRDPPAYRAIFRNACISIE